MTCVDEFLENDALDSLADFSTPPIGGVSAPAAFSMPPRGSGKVQDVYTTYDPPKPEMPPTGHASIPVLPLPEPTLKKKEKKQAQEAIDQDDFFEPFGPFGMPFKTESGSDYGLTPHPQLAMVRAIEDCSHTMTVGRLYTAKTICQGDHVKQRELSEEVDKKLSESIQKAREFKQLDYIQKALRLISMTAGIVGGMIVGSIGLNTGNTLATAYGAEMTVGGLLSLGAFCLDEIGSSVDKTWTSLMALGGALLSAHGGLMSAPLLINELPAHLAAGYSGVMSLLSGYETFRRIQVQEDMARFSGEMTILSKDRKVVSDDLKKHFGGLNIKEFNHFFKAANEFMDLMNRTKGKVVRETLKG